MALHLKFHKLKHLEKSSGCVTKKKWFSKNTHSFKLSSWVAVMRSTAPLAKYTTLKQMKTRRRWLIWISLSIALYIVRACCSATVGLYKSSDSVNQNTRKKDFASFDGIKQFIILWPMLKFSSDIETKENAQLKKSGDQRNLWNDILSEPPWK